MGHQGEDSATFDESVRLEDWYKERGELTAILTSPPSSLPSSPPPFLHPFRHSHNTTPTSFTSSSLIALILNLLTERLSSTLVGLQFATLRCFSVLLLLPPFLLTDGVAAYGMLDRVGVRKSAVTSSGKISLYSYSSLC